MKPHNIAFTIPVVVTTGILFGLMAAEIACQMPKPKQTSHYYQNSQVDTYPYYGYDTLHSRLIAIDTIGRWTHKWDVKAMYLRGEDGK